MQPDTVLGKICATTRAEVERRKAQVPLGILKEQILKAKPPRGFLNALRSKDGRGEPALIAEVKKASPSKGVIRADFDPADIARAYEQAGAACISVLTDEPYFQGRDDYLRIVKETVFLPVLRKDFMVDPYQIYESRALGADCILLIMAALSDAEAREFYRIATDLGMDTLFEAHDEPELRRALALEPELLGINNRNLKTLHVDLQTSYKLLPLIPDDILKVAESGIDGHETLAGLHEAGFHAFLVGESLTRQPDVARATQALLGTP